MSFKGGGFRVRLLEGCSRLREYSIKPLGNAGLAEEATGIHHPWAESLQATQPIISK
ncbi:hypothetical protein SAMD00023353_0300470 [Rosellinia necatrix]|uniref:Uncharacterized protein n=1 Tax=Rosellinia necatrix TaxID=77044 RepID=A0A1S8A570_ROSNE|nr:hypothetical protein SAMD00023353_0300470 [Rosellinia necatrix]